MCTLTLDPSDPILSLAQGLGADHAVYPGRLLSITIDGRLKMGATLGDANTLKVCFELGSMIGLDPATLLATLEEVSRWQSTTAPATLEVYDTELVLVWTAPTSDEHAFIQDLQRLTATCLAIQTFIEQRRKHAATACKASEPPYRNDEPPRFAPPLTIKRRR